MVRPIPPRLAAGLGSAPMGALSADVLPRWLNTLSIHHTQHHIKNTIYRHHRLTI